MHRKIAIFLSMALALLMVELLAWWWTHPTPAGLGQPVLVYRLPTCKQETGNLTGNQLNDPQMPSGNRSSMTLLPEIVEKSLPSLHCSTGTAARIDREDGVTIYLAFFEWNLADADDLLQAYKHLPEQCLGSIGMELIEHRPACSYQVGTETIVFNHTVFRDPVGSIVHAFKGTWVSGMNHLNNSNFKNPGDQWRKLRWKAALLRFRPAYSRVAQGAVRGISNPDLAWETFENAMLKDLSFQ